MGFFKKLKERLFTLNYEDQSIKKQATFIEKNVENNLISNQNEQKNQKLKIKSIKKQRKQIEKQMRLNKYVVGLKKSTTSFADRLKLLQTKYHYINEDYFEELEEILLMADVGVNMSLGIIDEIKQEVRKEQIVDTKLVNEIMIDKMFSLYVGEDVVNTNLNIEENRLNVILIIGVNGSGKTTSIAKLVNMFNNQGYKTLIAAADTFRAAAVEQLEVWANRLNTDIVKPNKPNQDPASVVFEAVQKAKINKYDILIIDTAGRLQNKVNLMNELAKIKKVIQREIPTAPHEVIMVLDATTGQNGINQAIEFKNITNISGIILTKMDGTSKGGIILAIKEKINVPVKFVGLGEKLEDLQEFDLDSFIYGLTKELID